MKETKIEWTDHSWSPWRGCTKVSPGCANCYAETLSKRNPSVLGQWGRGKPRVMAKNWNDPVRWNRNVLGDLDIVPGRPDRFTPYHRPTVFPSLCDWLDDQVPVEWLARFLQLIHDTPNLNWLLLTKRPENFQQSILAASLHLSGFRDGQTSENPTQPQMSAWEMAHDWISYGAAPRNVWIGTSVEDQTRANERIPELLRIPAVGRFLSVEPLLGPVDLERPMPGPDLGDEGSKICQPWFIQSGIDWVIIGGESGPGARPCNVEWIQSLVRQCKEASVPCFVKQVGKLPYVIRQGADGMPLDEHYFAVAHPKGGDPAEWPEDLREREFPEGLR